MKSALFICAIAVALAGCDNSSETSAASAAPQAQASPSTPSSADAVAVAPAAPTPPTHNYAMEDEGEYGYQPAISEDDAKNGVAAKPLEMVRYRGEQKGAYTVDAVDQTGAIFRMQCSEPCDYIKTRVIVEGQVIKTETVQNTPESLMHAVFEDAMNGQLQPYKQAKAKLESDANN